MKTKLFLTIALPLFLSVLASFAVRPGMDTFEVYLGNELLMKEHAYGQRSNNPIVLDKNSSATMTVSYDHCGITGSSRKLSLLDDQKGVLKEWTFANVGSKVKDPMPIAVKEIVAASMGKSATLYYKSNEIENAVMIAPVKLVDKTTARN
ncbi:hypothetical protein WBG78_16090 [Chryseolinea sp. T2]|uniref:hypothetical protein n=1 Tax=Chryseolinea sp. T2 TaxID=3129255 RepID=UPI00307852AD